MGTAGSDLLGDAGAGRPASTNGKRQRAAGRIRRNAGPPGGGGSPDPIRGDRCQGGAVAPGRDRGWLHTFGSRCTADTAISHTLDASSPAGETSGTRLARSVVV